MVGCTIVAGDQIVGEGWHRRFGGPHAEIEALRVAGARASGATLFVTLEPCCHHGKTPPCTQAIQRAGLRRVVVATSDPFPQVGGLGIAELRAAGIDVSLGLLADEARQLNAPYLKLVGSAAALDHRQMGHDPGRKNCHAIGRKPVDLQRILASRGAPAARTCGCGDGGDPNGAQGRSAFDGPAAGRADRHADRARHARSATRTKANWSAPRRACRCWSPWVSRLRQRTSTGCAPQVARFWSARGTITPAGLIFCSWNWVAGAGPMCWSKGAGD